MVKQLTLKIAFIFFLISLYLIIITIVIPDRQIYAQDLPISFYGLSINKEMNGVYTDITKVGLSDGFIRAAINVKNNSTSSLRLRMIVALYKNNSLINCVFSQPAYIEKDNQVVLESLPIEVINSTHDHYLKVYIWDDLNAMVPYTSMMVFKNYDISEDTYIRNGSYRNDNYGNTTQIYVKDPNGIADDLDRVIFMKANLTGVTGSSVSSAFLNFYVSNITTSDPINIGKTYKVIGYTNDNWNANDITWNNQPDSTGSTTLGFVHIKANGWQHVDVTTYINRQMEDKRITFKLVEESDGDELVEIVSADANVNKPYLAIVTGPPPIPGITNRPFNTIQAESGICSGNKIYSIQPGDIAYEAMGRECVELSTTGEGVQVTSSGSANKLTIRYSLLPLDNSNLITGTLSLYINGIHRRDLQLTNQRMLLPNTNGTSEFVRFWDEVTVDEIINPNDIIKLQKDSDDNLFAYYIDFVELEKPSDELAKPDNTWLSIADYGANGNDDNDDTAAIRSCISAASSGNKKVWIPKGNYYFNDTITIPDNIQFQGSGYWYSILHMNIPMGLGKKGLILGESNILKNFKLCEDNATTRLNEQGIRLANNCIVDSVWVEDISGAGILGYNVKNVIVRNCRIKGTYADGIHFADDSQFCLVEENYMRNLGDDGGALIAYSCFNNRNNVIRKNTNECSYSGRGITIQGGKFNTVELNMITDHSNCGLLAVVENYNGSTPNPYCYDFLIQDNEVVRCGRKDNNKFGAIWVWGRIDAPMSGDVQYNKVVSEIKQGISITDYASNEVNVRFNAIDPPNTSIGGQYIYKSLINGYNPVVSDNILK